MMSIAIFAYFIAFIPKAAMLAYELGIKGDKHNVDTLYDDL